MLTIDAPQKNKRDDIWREAVKGGQIRQSSQVPTSNAQNDSHNPHAKMWRRDILNCSGGLTPTITNNPTTEIFLALAGQ